MQVNIDGIKSRDDAEKIMLAIMRAQTSLVLRTRAVKRKRSWSPSVRAMTLAEYGVDRELLEVIYKALGEHFRLGGY